MKVTNLDHDDCRASRAQLGVDPHGGVVTGKAIWTEEDGVNFKGDPKGWRYPTIIFDRPVDSQAFTVYFRHRDGLPKNARDRSYPPEPNEDQSQGTATTIDAYCDWIAVDVIR